MTVLYTLIIIPGSQSCQFDLSPDQQFGIQASDWTKHM